MPAKHQPGIMRVQRGRLRPVGSPVHKRASQKATGVQAVIR